ncbi:MAG: hypothetical protein ACJ72H_25860 [Candidatus Sulfotelmatobacter sp.]
MTTMTIRILDLMTTQQLKNLSLKQLRQRCAATTCDERTGYETAAWPEQDGRKNGWTV